MRHIRMLAMIVVLLTLSTVSVASPPFGGKEDLAFAGKLWQAMDGYRTWAMKSGIYPGESPHGKQLRVYSNVVTVDGKPYDVFIKDNFGGPSVAEVTQDPNKYLVAVTVMVRREDGYDPEHGNWFWVKYQPDGTVARNAADMSLAGRVAKGTTKGCIACHGDSKGGDYFYTNDR